MRRPTRLCTRPRAVARPGAEAPRASATRCVALLACVGTRSGECLIRCTDWIEHTLASSASIRRHGVHRHMPSLSPTNEQQKLRFRRKHFGKYRVASFTTPNPLQTVVGASQSSLREPGTESGASCRRCTLVVSVRVRTSGSCVPDQETRLQASGSPLCRCLASARVVHVGSVLPRAHTGGSGM
jgi:hypothetical protein